MDDNNRRHGSEYEPNFVIRDTDETPAASSQETENPGSASWDSESGLRQSWRQKNRGSAKQPSKPVNLTRKGLALLIALCIVVSGAFGIGGAALGSYIFDGSSGPAKEGSVKTTGYTLEDATEAT